MLRIKSPEKVDKQKIKTIVDNFLTDYHSDMGYDVKYCDDVSQFEMTCVEIDEAELVLLGWKLDRECLL